MQATTCCLGEFSKTTNAVNFHRGSLSSVSYSLNQIKDTLKNSLKAEMHDVVIQTIYYYFYRMS